MILDLVVQILYLFVLELVLPGQPSNFLLERLYVPEPLLQNLQGSFQGW